MTSIFSSPTTKEMANDITNLTLNSSTQEVENTLLETSVAESTLSETFSEKMESGSPPVDKVNVKGVWGDHLSNKNTNKRGKGLPIGKYSSFQLSQKMFKSSSFSKKNPRKSLSMSKIKSKTDLNLSNVSTAVVRNDGFDAIEITESLYGEKVKIVHEETKIATQPLNTIQQLIEGRTLTSRTINQGWLERCGMKNAPDVSPIEPRRLSGVSDSGVESMESSIHSFKESVQSNSVNVDNQSTHDSDEDFVFNSDSEEERRNKRIRNLNKLSCDVDNNLAKRPCITNFSLSYNQPVSSKSLFDFTPQENKQDPKVEILSQRNENLISQEGNLTDKIEKEATVIEKEETDELPKAKRTLTKRKGRRRIKDESDDDDDSDPEYEVNTKKKAKRNTKVSRARKSVNKEDSAVKTRRPRRSPKQKENLEKEVVVDENDITFGIESLDVIPRLPMKGYGTGDLITDFSKVLAAEKESDAAANKSQPKNKMTAKEKLEQKMAKGELNDNYVRVNLKKKVFVRGKKNFNFSKFKKGQWKQRRKDLAASAASLDAADYAEKNGGACSICGEMGHFARQCKAHKGDELLPLEHVSDVSEFPTLEEAEEMARKKALIAHSSRIDRLPKTLPKKVEGGSENEDELEFSDWDDEAPEEEVIYILKFFKQFFSFKLI